MVTLTVEQIFQAVNLGIISVNEARKLLGMPKMVKEDE